MSHLLTYLSLLQKITYKYCWELKNPKSRKHIIHIFQKLLDIVPEAEARSRHQRVHHDAMDMKKKLLWTEFSTLKLWLRLPVHGAVAFVAKLSYDGNNAVFENIWKVNMMQMYFAIRGRLLVMGGT